MIYLDNAATTFIKPREVAEAVYDAMQTMSSPGRGGYREAMAASEALLSCRETAAELFDVKSPENVVFTGSATHGLNIAIKSLVSAGDRVVVSGFEHNAVMRPLSAIGAGVVYARSGLFDPDELIVEFDKAVTPDTKAVVCTHVSNVFGYILPIEKIAALCKERGVPLIVDASQSAGIFEVSMKKLDAEFIAMPGHKGLYGPQGTGLLLCKNAGKTLIEGGTGSNSAMLEMPDFLPDRLEPGTHNMPGICGLEAGMAFVKKEGIDAIRAHEQALVDYAAEQLLNMPGASAWNARVSGVQSGVLSMNVKNLDCEIVAEHLSQVQIAVRAGLHCAPVAHETAGTLKSGTVRISFSAFNTKREVKKFCEYVNKLSILTD